MRKLLFLFIVLLFVTSCQNSREPLMFAQLTDIHVTPGSQSEKHLLSVVEEINELDLDFVVVTGDLTNTGSNAELLAAKNVLDQLTIPYYAVPGNHETNWSESAGQKFNELWGDDRFMFSKNGYLFVGFNTGPYMRMGDGHVKQEDLQWLQRELDSGKEDHQMLISMAHYPLAEGLDNWTDVTEILNDFNCRLAFCGHGHRINLFNFDGIPGVMGRSTVVSGSDIPGYTLVELKNDSAFIYEKEVEVPDKEQHYAIDLLSPDTLEHIDVSPRPDYSVNDEYSVDVLFEFTDNASVFTGPCPVNDSLLVYGNSLGLVKGIKVPSKEIAWEKEYKGSVFSTPVTDGQCVAFGTVEGNIIGLNAFDGGEMWQVNAGTPVLAEGVVNDGHLYIGGGQSAFFKIDMSNGEVVWMFDEINGLVQGKPAIGKTEVVFGAWDRHLYSLDKETGELNWKWNNGTSVQLYSPGNIAPAIANDRVFLVAPDRYMTALDRRTGEVIWRTDKHQVRESMGHSPDGKQIYAKLMNDSIIAMSSESNSPETLWAIDAGIGYDHNPCPLAANKKMVIGATKNGLISAIAADGEKVLWKHKAGNSSVNKMVIDNDSSLWLTLMEGRVLKLVYP